ncbi:MAG TPA: endonuclease domain-containing protein [Polyangia bacterium]|nr:endonuclease domain-containing protein [Polyangia bacterium]
MDAKLEQRRDLRRESTSAEAVLWRLLRRRKVAGLKFRRQHPFGRYVLDFYCAQHRLAIELDGGQHFLMAGRAYDGRRDAYLISRGLTVLRFGTDLVFRDRGQVLRAIAVAVGIDVSFDDLEDRSASP